MDHLRDLDRLEFVKQQLALYPGEKRDGGTHVKILCPFHAEKTPSASINLSNRGAPGWLHCFGCGADYRYDDWAPEAGLEPYAHSKPKEKYAASILMSYASDDREQAKAEDLPFVEWKLKHWELPKGKKWRSVPTDLLIELGGRLCVKYSPAYKSWGKTKYIDLPVMINGERRGMFLARLKKHETEASYYLAKSNGSSWSKTWGLWPFDYSTSLMRRLGSSTMVLVEGQRDALRLILNGIPAVCIFGTQSWSANKARLLELAGVERVVQFFDGDRAGIGATEKSAPDLKKLFDVRTVRLWKIKGSPFIPYLDIEDDKEQRERIKADGVQLWDPMNCPQWIIDRIKTRYV